MRAEVAIINQEDFLEDLGAGKEEEIQLGPCDQGQHSWRFLLGGSLLSGLKSYLCPF